MILRIQSFLKCLGQTAESVIRILLLSKFKVRLKSISIKQQEVIILGNGPSLTDDLENNIGFLKNKDLVCVNHFPKTELYERLRPSYFVTSAPDLWLDNIEPKFVKSSKKLFEQINMKTCWPLTLFIPLEAKKHHRWRKQLEANASISIQYYNNTPIEGWNFFKNWGFKANLGMPRPHNVMIPSLMLSIGMGYQRIFLLGADHSWLSEISVTSDNEVLINQKHFYDQDSAKGQPLDKRGKGKRTLPELLYKFMTAFNSYFEIRRYADFKKISILNATRNSFIDAFERLNLEELADGK